VVAAHHLRVVPDGCTELVYSADQGLLVYGPGLDWSDVELEPHAHFWGIRLMPAAAASVLRVNMSELGGRIVPATDIMGPQSWNQSSLHGWLPRALTVVAERTSTCPPDLMTANAAESLTDRPSQSLPCLAKELGVSERHLRRQFIQATGLTPASYRRIARMKRAVAKARTTRSSWATIAHDTGFSDQSHLVRELRALTGMSPTELFGSRA
jgi:AraC-like DNA-binding protein